MLALPLRHITHVPHWHAPHASQYLALHSSISNTPVLVDYPRLHTSRRPPITQISSHSSCRFPIHRTSILPFPSSRFTHISRPTIQFPIPSLPLELFMLSSMSSILLMGRLRILITGSHATPASPYGTERLVDLQAYEAFRNIVFVLLFSIYSVGGGWRDH